MPKLKFSVKNTEFGENSDFEEAMPGVYVAKIKEINPGYSKGENGKPDKKRPRLEVIYHDLKPIDDLKSKVRYGQIWDYLSHSEAAEFRMAQFLEAIGVATKKKREGEWDPDKKIGMVVKIRVRADSNLQGDYRPKIGGVFPYDPAEDEEDEYEDAETDEEEDDEEEDEEEEEDDDEEDEDEESEDEDEDDDEEEEEAEDDDEEEEDDDDDDDEDEDYSDMELSDLRALVVERGLLKKKEASNKKSATLIKLLEADDEESDDDEDEEEDRDYEDFSVAELREECESRDLKATGSKKAMIKRLEEDDESDEADDDEDEDEAPF